MSQAKKIKDLFLELQKDLSREEAVEIICRVCSCAKSDVFLNGEAFVCGEKEKEILRIAALRKTGKPLCYCTNRAYFYDREFFVDENVLIPRFDTEILLETVLKNEDGSAKKVLELGTGSGIICEILSGKRENWHFVSTDISPRALAVAQKNRFFTDAPNKIFLVNSDKFSAISPEKRFDLIVSNPPYIESATIKTLDESVRDFEPKIALDGGENGLEFYEYIAENARLFLKRGGRIYVEIGFNQGQSVPQIFERNGFSSISLKKDFGDNPRVVSCEVF